MIYPDADTRDADWLKTLELDEGEEWTEERVQMMIDALGADAPALESIIELERLYAWDPKKHPRNPKGHKGGGRFRSIMGALLRPQPRPISPRERDLLRDDDGSGVGGGPAATRRHPRARGLPGAPTSSSQRHRAIPELPPERRIRKGDLFYYRDSLDPDSPDEKPLKMKVTKIAKGRVWYGMGENPAYATGVVDEAEFRKHAIELSAFDRTEPKFKVGQTVRIKTETFVDPIFKEMYADKPGRIIEVLPGEEYPYRIQYETGNDYDNTVWAKEDHLVLVEAPPEGDLEATVRRLREEMGRPLEKPEEENRHARALANRERYAEETKLVEKRLTELEPGEEIDLAGYESLLAVQAPDAPPNLQRQYGYPWRFRRSPTDPDMIEVQRSIARLREPGTGKEYGWEPTLGYSAFAKSFREGLLYHFRLGRYDIPEPTDDEVRDRLARWRLRSHLYVPGVGRFTRIRLETDPEKRGWTFIEEKPNGYLAKESRTITDEDEVFDLAGEQVRQKLIDERLKKASGGIGDYSPRERAGEFQTPTGAPGEPYVRQHEKIMEIGRAVDSEIQRRLTESAGTAAERERLQEEVFEAQRHERELKATERARAWEIAVNEIMGILSEEDRDPLEVEQKEPYIMGQMNYKNPDAQATMKDDAGNTMVANAPTWSGDEFAGLWFHGNRYAASTDEERLWAGKLVLRTEQAVSEDEEMKALLQEEVATKVLMMNAQRAADRISNVGVRRREAVLGVLGELRPLGGVQLKIREFSSPLIETRTERTEREQKVAETLDYAAGVYPMTWLQVMEERNRSGVSIIYSENERGYYQASGDTIQYGQSGSKLRGAPKAHGTMVHELGHRAEYAMPQLGSAEWTFWHRRKKDAEAKYSYLEGQPASVPRPYKVRPLREIEPWSGYESWEHAMQDDFKDSYSGKVYAGGSPNTSWEVLTMGMQSLFENDRPEVVWEDDDYRQWLLGVLAAF